MEIATQPATPANHPVAANADRRGAANALSSDFETFLLMLTTQMQNQDPLNPIESQDFAVQLATFSGVEQQVRTNAILENFAGGFGMSGLAQLAGWVGMDARIVAPASFDGSPMTLAPTPDPGADAASLVVLDANGREIQQQSVPLGPEVFEWAGTDTNGSPLPPGNYTFELHSFSEGEMIGVAQVPHYARITEARLGTDGIELVMDGGIVVSSDAVSALRQHDKSPEQV